MLLLMSDASQNGKRSGAGIKGMGINPDDLACVHVDRGYLYRLIKYLKSWSIVIVFLCHSKNLWSKYSAVATALLQYRYKELLIHS